MSRSDDDELPWPPTASHTARAELGAPATRVVRDREDYLGQGGRDIGRRIADDQVELFVAGDPVAGLAEQFDRLQPAAIVLHDVGSGASLALLGALAGPAGAQPQRLTVRRQGHGVALAVLQFVEVPLGAAGDVGIAHVRIYSTDCNADTPTRRALAQLLLSRSRLGVLMLGELPPHALLLAMAPLREAVARGPWPNREMLVLPLGSGSALAAQAAQALASSSVAVRVTPLAARSADAWAFIGGAWNRLHDREQQLRTDIAQALPRAAPPQSEAPTMVMPLAAAERPALPPRGAAAAAAVARRWSDYCRRCAAIRGVVSACVFDLRTQLPLAHAGSAPPTPERLAIQGGLLIDAMADAARLLGLPSLPPDASVSYGRQHLVLHAVAGHAGIVVHAVVDAAANDLVLARMQLERVPPPPAPG